MSDEEENRYAKRQKPNDEEKKVDIFELNQQKERQHNLLLQNLSKQTTTVVQPAALSNVIFPLIWQFLPIRNNEFVTLILVCKFWYKFRQLLSSMCDWLIFKSNLKNLVGLKPKSLFYMSQMRMNKSESQILQGFNLETFTYFYDADFEKFTSVTKFVSPGRYKSDVPKRVPPNIKYLRTASWRLPRSNTVKHIVHNNATIDLFSDQNYHIYPKLEVFESESFRSLPNLVGCPNLTSLALGSNATLKWGNMLHIKDTLPLLVNLQKLYIWFLDDLSPLSKLTNLKLLQCREAKFEELGNSLPSGLEVLEIPQPCYLRSLEGLGNLKNLRILNIDMTFPTKFNYDDLPSSLTHISVYGTELNLEWPLELKRLTNLKYVRVDSSLRCTFISDLLAKNANVDVEFYSVPHCQNMLVPWVGI